MVEEIEDPFCLENAPVVVTLDEIKEARERIKDGVIYTHCGKSHMDDIVGMEVFLKEDFKQYTGSFKERGARNALLKLIDAGGAKGVIAVSAGNHAQAMAYHGKQLNIPVTVVMPKTAPIMKIQKCIKYGAEVIVEGADLAESKRISMKMGKDQGLLFINGYDHPDILRGQGTCGLEILEQVPDVDAIICPTGGGGLLAGVAAAVNALKPTCQVIGVESEAMPGMGKSFEAGKPVPVDTKPTLADGLAVRLVGFNSFATCKNTVAQMVAVKEELIALAMLKLIELEKAVVEGAGCTSIAALFSGKVDHLKGKKVVCILSGGNVDTSVLSRTIERGLVMEGRYVKTSIILRDAPGTYKQLISDIADNGANIKYTYPERAWVSSDVHSVRLKFLCETRDYGHALELRKLLESKYDARFPSFPDKPIGYGAAASSGGKKSCTCK